jgi:hypothetical protein
MLERILTGEIEVIEAKFTDVMMPCRLNLSLMIIPAESPGLEKRPLRIVSPPRLIPSSTSTPPEDSAPRGGGESGNGSGGGSSE